MFDISKLLELEENQLLELEEGSFDSPECLALLDESDVVVTNPPFSLLRKIIDLLIDKKYLIVAPLASSAKYNKHISSVVYEKSFYGYNEIKTFDIPNQGSSSVGIATWIQNLQRPDRPKLELTKSYNPSVYPKYDNYDAIECSKVKDIPNDYYGVIGVPITFLLSHNYDQFELMGIADGNQYKVNRIKSYPQGILHRPDGTIQRTSRYRKDAVLRLSSPPENKAYTTNDEDNGFYLSLYTRLLIKRKK